MTSILYFQLLPVELKKELLYYILPQEVYEKCHNLSFTFCGEENYWKFYSEAITKSYPIFNPKKLWLKSQRTQISYLSTVRVYPSLRLLNFLGPYYWGSDGFDFPIEENEGLIDDIDDINTYNMMYELDLIITLNLPNDLPENINEQIAKSNIDSSKIFYDYLNSQNLEDLSELNAYTYELDTDKLKELASKEILYPKITIKYIKDTWYGKPKEWYKKYIRKNKLEPIQTRPYITVVNPFMEVKLEVKKKGKPLTLDDVLFASRALMIDSGRTVFKYFIISENVNELVLKPDIDNFST